MRRAGGLVTAIALVLSLIAAGGEGDLDGRGPTAVPRSENPQLEPRDCGELPPDITVTVECHFLVVPMNREKPEGDTIRLAVAVLKSRAAQPASDPVVYLEGGPGGSVVENGLATFSESPMLEQRDVVLFDQRGTGLSEPALECPEREEAVVRNLGRGESYETELADYRDAFDECRARLEDEGIDLDGFDTEASAADLADLRVSLGVEEWNLYGASYGTRLALATLRSHPEGIRSAILDSVYPPGVGLAHQDRRRDRRCLSAALRRLRRRRRLRGRVPRSRGNGECRRRPVQRDAVRGDRRPGRALWDRTARHHG